MFFGLGKIILLPFDSATVPCPRRMLSSRAQRQDGSWVNRSSDGMAFSAVKVRQGLCGIIGPVELD